MSEILSSFINSLPALLIGTLAIMARYDKGPLSKTEFFTSVCKDKAVFYLASAMVLFTALNLIYKVVFSYV